MIFDAMGEGKFFLNWEEFETASSERFQHLVGNQEFSDVTLVAGDGSRIFGHQVILATGCTFFRTLLEEERSPKPLIFLRGIEAALIESLLDFLYTGKAEVNEELLTNFMALADDLGVEGLATNIGQTVNEIDEEQKDSKEHLKDEIKEAKLISTLDWTGLEGPNKESLEKANAQRPKSNQNLDQMSGDKKNGDKVHINSDPIKHIDSIHNKSKVRFEISDDQIVNPEKGRNGLFRCNFCERTIRFRHNFRRHIRLRHKNPTKSSELIRMSKKSEGDGPSHC